jgi:hypothetical protein
MPSYWNRSVQQFGVWTVVLVGYVVIFVGGSLLIAQWAAEESFLVTWRAFFFSMIYLPFGAVSVYAMGVAWQVYVDGEAFPDNLFFSSGSPADSPAASSRFESQTFQRAGAAVDHVRLWFYVLTGPVLAGLTLDDAITTFTRLLAG